MALPQPLHIFRKDVLHLWPETLVVVGLFIAFAFAAPSRWTASPYAVGIQLLAFLLKVLILVSWLVVIARLIQDESLVGDRQFWTSRPYHWGNLIAAKVLYILVFIYLPFLIMQAYLLKHAGLHPMLALPTLLHNLLLLTVVIIVPLMALATVTGTFARMLLSAVGALLYVLALAVALFFIAFARMIPQALEPFTIGIFIVLPLLALIYQYATRKTTNSRLMLLATPLVIFVLLLLTPVTSLIHSAYPVVSGPGVPAIGTIPAELAVTQPKPGRVFVFRNVRIGLPLAITGGDEKNVYAIDGAAVTVNGVEQPYLSTTGTIGGPAPYSVFNFPLNADIFNKVKANPADLHLSLATEHLTVGDPQAWKATLLPFDVPGHGNCSYSSDNPEQQPVCHFPLAPPDNTFVSAPLSLNCAAEQPGLPPRQVTAGARISGESSGFSVPDFDPVITLPLNLRTRQQLPAGVNLVLCPGTPLSFINAKSVGKARFEFDEKQVPLDNYAMRIPERGGPPIE